MIQRTAIWILATFALCSPGTIVIGNAREPIGAGYEVWSVQIGSDELRQTVAQENLHRSRESCDQVRIVAEAPSTAASRLFFGSLYNRPPPSLLSLS